MDIAITCIAHTLLRHTASLAARHAGYRVIDTETPADAMVRARRTRPDLMLIGVLADPAGDLVRWCTSQGITYRIVTPQIPVAELGDMLGGIRRSNRDRERAG